MHIMFFSCFKAINSSPQAKVHRLKPTGVSPFPSFQPYLLLITLVFQCFILHPYQTAYNSTNSLCGFRQQPPAHTSLPALNAFQHYPHTFTHLSRFNSQINLSLKLFVITLPLPQIEQTFPPYVPTASRAKNFPEHFVIVILSAQHDACLSDCFIDNNTVYGPILMIYQQQVLWLNTGEAEKVDKTIFALITSLQSQNKTFQFKSQKHSQDLA